MNKQNRERTLGEGIANKVNDIVYIGQYISFLTWYSLSHIIAAQDSSYCVYNLSSFKHSTHVVCACSCMTLLAGINLAMLNWPALC